MPHFKDVPTIEVHAMNRKDVEAAGAGETPIIVDRAGDRQRGVPRDGQRIRSMPMKLPKASRSGRV